MYQPVRMCACVCEGAISKTGLGCHANPAPGVSGGGQGFVCLVCDHPRVSAGLTGVSAGCWRIGFDQGSRDVTSGLPAVRGCC